MKVRCLFLACVLPVLLQAAGVGPRDWRHRIDSGAFRQTADGQWTSPVVRPDFSFNELIYSWHLRKPGDTFRLYLKVDFGKNDQTDWLYAGFWGAVKDPVEHRVPPKFNRGILDMDFLKLKTNAVAFQFKFESAGATPLAAAPSLSVVATDNPFGTNPPPLAISPSNTSGIVARVLDIPLRRQVDSHGVHIPDRCQSAALASAMEYYGKSVTLDDIIKYTYDPEYGYPGIWPRVIGAAQEFGYDGYIERFRDWDSVRRAVADNKIVLCSIRMKEGECKSPPYRSMGNHIVAMCGVTDDGRVVVTDSALGKSGEGHLCQWLQEDFQKIWMEKKGGIAMVICPPAKAAQHDVPALAAFPADRKFPNGDDH